MRIPICTSVLAGFLNLILAAVLHAAAGDPDLSFAGTGRTRFGFGFGEDFAYAVAVQTDGKIVVAGASGDHSVYGGNFSMVRYDTNDALDNSFGVGGKVMTPILGNGNFAEAKAMGIQADGKIVLAGWVFYQQSNTFFAVARYNPDGSLDSSFGTNGVTTTAIGTLVSANAMAIQSDGKIVVAGNTSDGSGNSGDIALVRYTTEG